MLLGSPPDMVRGISLRKTGRGPDGTQASPGVGIHPRCSGLQVQGTAISPTSATLL